MPQTRKQKVFFILGGFFIMNALLAEVTAGKLFTVGPISLGLFQLDQVVLTIGVLLWPVVFIGTDIINEYFGRSGVKKLTFLTTALIAIAFLFLYSAMSVPAWDKSPVKDAEFNAVFGQSLWIIAGSLAAFLTSQLVDVLVFTFFKSVTKDKFLWLRATGSTVVSQIIDTFVVGFIGFVVPGKLSMVNFLPLAAGNYAYKLLIAIAITPLIYLIHYLIDKYLEKDEQQ